MSATTANKASQPAYSTTGRGAALYITLGIFSLTLGLAWALSLMVPARDSYVLSQLAMALRGLCGPMCPFLPVLCVWGGAKLLVASRHRVSARDFLIVAALYWLALAGHTLIAQVSQGTGFSLPYLDYVTAQTQKTMPYGADTFAAYLNRDRIPAIVLAEGPVTAKTLLESALPNAYLSFPFLPEDLNRVLREVAEKTCSAETLRRGGVEVDVSGFCIAGTAVRLTNGEIDLLRELSAPRRTAGKRTRAMIQALNEKLKNAGKPARIIYEMEKLINP